MKNKAILINNIRVGKYDEEKNKYIQKNIKMFEYKENETINCKTSDDKQFDVEIGICTNDNLGKKNWRGEFLYTRS